MESDWKHKYELDFAIPKLKIAFEINGNQHYLENGKLTNYYQKRHDFFINLGWYIIEIPYEICFNKLKIKKIIIDALKFDINYDEINNVINHRILRKNEKILERKKRELNKERERIKLKELNNKRKEIIIKLINQHGNKYGILKKIQDELNLSHTHIRRLCNKFNIKIYNRKLV